jgi:ankyrin repeat protein
MVLLALPPELYFIIATFLEPKELATLLRTSKQIYPIIDDILYYRDAKSDSPAALLWAVKKGRLNTARKAIIAHKWQCTSHDIESECTIQSTLNGVLCLASSGGHTRIVQLLLDEGADANVPRRGRPTALKLASLHRHEKIIQILLNNNAH